jgi:hypothetical protein
MSETGESGIGAKERLQVLIAEYNTLRAEAIQRNSVLIQIMTVGGTVLTTILTASIAYGSWAIFTLVVVLSNVLLVAYKVIEFDILRFSVRLRALEEEINCRAGERLLIWETEQGLHAVGPEDRVVYIQATYLSLGRWGVRMLAQSWSKLLHYHKRGREIWKRIAKAVR